MAHTVTMQSCNWNSFVKEQGEWWDSICTSIYASISGWEKVRQLLAYSERNPEENLPHRKKKGTVKLAVPAASVIMPLYSPFLPLPFLFSSSSQYGGSRVVGLAPLPYRDQLKNPVSVPGEQGSGLVSPSKTRKGTQLGPGATPRAGQFSLLLPHIGG